MEHSNIRFHQIGELLRWIADFHAQQQRCYTEAAESTDDQRVRMALEYLAEHEQTMQSELERYLEQAHAELLDTWFDDAVALPHTIAVEHQQADHAALDVEDVLATGITVHRTIEALYRQRQVTAPTPEIGELFDALVRHQNAELRRMVRDMGRLQSM